MKINKDLMVRNNTVVKANDLIQKSRFSLSLQQQKIVLYLISQITPQDEDFRLYEFSIPNFCRVVGIDATSGENYRELKKSIQDIRNKSIWIDLPDGRTATLAWIEKAYINHKSGTVQIRLDADMKPYLLQLKENFTQYEIIWTLRFRSKYSPRLYELIKSVHYHELETYEREFQLDQVQQRMGAERYKQFKDFHTRALRPAVKEINQYSDKAVAYELIKQGRNVVGIKFTISTKPAIERLQIRDQIEKDFGMNQLSLWDELESKGMV